MCSSLLGDDAACDSLIIILLSKPRSRSPVFLLLPPCMDGETEKERGKLEKKKIKNNNTEQHGAMNPTPQSQGRSKDIE